MYEITLYTLYFLHVSAIRVAIFRDMHYKGQIYQNITEVCEQMCRYKIFNFENNTWFKMHIKIKIYIKIGEIDVNV